MRERKIKSARKVGCQCFGVAPEWAAFAMVVVYSQSMPSGLMNKEQNVLL
jgi:hypothetical protein